MGEYRPQSLSDRSGDAGPLTGRGGRRLHDADGQEEQRRHDVRDGVDEDRKRRTDQLTSMPPAPGPTTCAIEAVTSYLLLPSTSRWRSTSEGRYERSDTSNNTVSAPAESATAYRSSILSIPSTLASGTISRNAARARSSAISPTAAGADPPIPAKRPTSSVGADSAQTGAPLPGRRVEHEAAMSGSASADTCEPMSEMADAVDSLRNAGWREGS